MYVKNTSREPLSLSFFLITVEKQLSLITNPFVPAPYKQKEGRKEGRKDGRKGKRREKGREKKYITIMSDIGRLPECSLLEYDTALLNDAGEEYLTS